MKKKILVVTIIFILNLVCMSSANYFPDQMSAFKDVPYTHWAFDDIKLMNNLGIVKGKAPNLFKPNDEVTTAEFFAMLSRVLTLKFGSQANDVKNIKVYLDEPMKSHWSYNEYCNLAKYFEAMKRELSVQKGLAGLAELGKTKEAKKGVYDDLGKTAIQTFIAFSPKANMSSNEVKMKYDKPITRQQAAATMGLFFTDRETVTTNIINAEDWLETRNRSGVNIYYRTYINELIERGLFNGVKEGNKVYIYPNRTLTRAEAAALVCRVYKNIKLID